jgi:hypothetical protein
LRRRLKATSCSCSVVLNASAALGLPFIIVLAIPKGISDGP